MKKRAKSVFFQKKAKKVKKNVKNFKKLKKVDFFKRQKTIVLSKVRLFSNEQDSSFFCTVTCAEKNFKHHTNKTKKL